MPAKQIVTDPEVATNIQKRLVDPRDIEAIILTTTQDEPPIRGFDPQETLAISVWADANKTCYSVLEDLPQPDVSVHTGPGSGTEGRTAVSTGFIKSYIDRRPSDKGKVLAFIQSKGVPQYPAGKSGPRYFQLVTICRSAKAQKNEIRILDTDILPECDATGGQLVEFRILDISASSPVRTLQVSRATLPAGGKISIQAGKLRVPDQPIIPFIRGDGTGPDIWAASVRVFDAAVQKAYGGKRKVAWFEVFAGEASKNKFDNWLPDDTVEAFKEFLVGIKGPLTTPVGGGIRSLNVALRQMLDLYVCLRPVQWFMGVPSPVKHPEKVNMVIFRENTEDIYAGIDFQCGSEPAKKTLEFLQTNFPKEFKKIRFGAEAGDLVGIGIKPVSKPGTERLVRAAIAYAITNKRKSVTIVHKGNIMKFTEGAFRDWGYELAKREFGAVEIDGGPWCKIPEGKPGAGLVIKDAIADIALQQVLTRPEDFDVIATLNLNGDYLSDALAAQVGGIGIAPGGNINYITGHAIFEATHGTAPKYAGKDMVNPGSVVLSGEMMLRHLGWVEAADLILKGLNGAIASKRVTYDFARLMPGATQIKCSEFGDNLIAHI